MKSFDDINCIEHSSIKISIFCYDTTLFAKYLCPQTIRQHRSTELAAVFVGKRISLSAATLQKYDANRLYSIQIKNSTGLWQLLAITSSELQRNIYDAEWTPESEEFSFHIVSYCYLQEAQAYADENGLLFMETSAKTALNVNEIFLAIGM